ncbi:hypothetical protein FQZ97_904350 [compost metagenome]
MQGPGQFGGGGTVGSGMVGLGQDGETALGNTLHIVQPLDHVHLPWRAGEIHRPGMDARYQDAELSPVAWLGQGEMADMEVDVEQIVLDPVWVSQAEWHLHDLPTERRRSIEPAFDMTYDIPETEALPLHGRLVVDVDHRAVRCRMRTIHVEEHGIEAIELANHSDTRKGSNPLRTSVIRTGNPTVHECKACWRATAGAGQ